MLDRITSIAYSMLRNVSPSRILGRLSAGTGGVEELTAGQIRDWVEVGVSPSQFVNLTTKTHENTISPGSIFNTASASDYNGAKTWTPVEGQIIKIVAGGTFSTDATTPGWLRLRSVSGVDTGTDIKTLWQSNTVNPSHDIVGVTDGKWFLEVITVISGTSGADGQSISGLLVIEDDAGNFIPYPISEAVTGVNWSSTSGFDIEWAWETADVDNVLKIEHAHLDLFASP